MAFLGIDIGTSGCKALALSGAGEILASHTATYDMSQPHPGWTEQDPAIWVEGARETVSKVLEQVPRDQIRAIGLSGQMHGFTPIDAAGSVLRPAILWNDQRNAAEADEIVALAGGLDALLSMTNNPMLVGYTGGKILWMQRHEPALFEKVSHALNPKDYLRYVLTNEIATEVSDASGTGLFDVRGRRWCTELIDKLPFDGDILPTCHESHVISAEVSERGAEMFGFLKGTPVVGGGGDSVIQTFGSGVVAPGVLQTTIGTAGITATPLEQPTDNPDGCLQVFCNVAPDLWHCMGVSLNAGGALSWLRTNLCAYAQGSPEFKVLVDDAAKVAAGAEGLIFLPYLNGERCPHPDPTARGAFVGLTGRHGAPDMIRALMEGVVFALYDVYLLMKKMGQPSELIKASGGGAQSELWRQIQADLFDCPVVTTKGAAEGGAFGAAMLAGVSKGAWADLSEAAGCCKELTRQEPNQNQTRIYREVHAIYAPLYEALRPSFEMLSKRGESQ